MISNFRDFGGVPAGGRLVRKGVLYRSGQPGPLGTVSIETLEAFGFEMVVDLRFADEVRHAAIGWNGPPPRTLALEEGAGGDAPHHAFFREAPRSVDAVHDVYSRFYQALPGDPRYCRLVARALRRISSDEGPVLIHCSAGKDRTGFVCALLLQLLGVDAAAIEADYLASNAPEARAALRPELERRFTAHGSSLPEGEVLDAMLGVAPSYLAASFGTIWSEFGTTDTYLDAIGVDSDVRERLRARLLR